MIFVLFFYFKKYTWADGHFKKWHRSGDMSHFSHGCSMMLGVCSIRSLAEGALTETGAVLNQSEYVRSTYDDTYSSMSMTKVIKISRMWCCTHVQRCLDIDLHLIIGKYVHMGIAQTKKRVPLGRTELIIQCG